MSEQLIVNGPRGRVPANGKPDAETQKAFDLLAEKLAPMVAKLMEVEDATPATNSRKITDAYTPPSGDEWDTLPDGDDPPAAPGGADQYELPD